MNRKPTHLITVRFRQTDNGLVSATSEDLPGLVLTYRDREQIVQDLPEAIRTLYKVDYQEDVEVLALESPADPPKLREAKLGFAAIPTETLRSLRRAGA